MSTRGKSAGTGIGAATYLVGGAVRDELLGRPVHERDWVVVGATREEMLHAGFRQVGRDFPVFLHPQTNDEYALARTERKQGAGHVGFVVHAAPEISLEEDLRRRDLTINAIARAESGEIIDPYGGVADLHARVLRHVSPAFSEDPLRVFRVARFAAQLAPWGFRVAAETRQLMADMAASGELAALSAERVWAELAKALGSDRGSVFMAVLREAEACAPWFVPWQARHPRDLPAPVPADDWTLARRFAAFAAPLDRAEVVAASARLKAPKACAELARMRAAEAPAIDGWQSLPASAMLDLLQRCDALRRADRFTALCDVVAALAAPAIGRGSNSLAARARRLAALTIDLSAGGDPARTVREQRLAALQAWAGEDKGAQEADAPAGDGR